MLPDLPAELTKGKEDLYARRCPLELRRREAIEYAMIRTLRVVRGVLTAANSPQGEP